MLGLIFLKFADNNYRRHEAQIIAEYQKLKGTRREKKLSEIAIDKCGFYLPDHARYDYLLSLPEEKDIAKALKEAMRSIEEYKPELEGVLPKDEYSRLTRAPKTKTIPNSLLKNFANIPSDTTGDLFGQIYEYFLAEFARSEGQKGGEFFTPRSVVRLMVEIIEPHGGKVFDPACDSGGMFVQSAKFIEEHRKELSANGKDSSVYVYGQEKTLETVNLAKMNLAVNGLRGEIKKGITYYDDHFNSFRAFDYVLARGVYLYRWFDDEQDENGKSEYDYALENGWSNGFDPFITEHETGRRLYLSYSVTIEGVRPNIVEVTSSLHEFYLRYLGRDASNARAWRVSRWWESNWPRIERDLDALPVAGGVMAARRGVVKVGTKLSDAVSKLRLRHLSLTSGSKKLWALGLNERVTKTGRRKFFDPSTGAVRAAWDAANKKGGNHWHKFAFDGKTPLNDAGRVVGKATTAAHIPSK